MAVHVMVDIETFGTGRKALPISIGAVKFDGTTILDRFHVGIDPASAQAAGLTISADTMLWWLDDDRRDAWHSWQALDKVSLTEALQGFAMWYQTPPELNKDELPFEFQNMSHQVNDKLPIWGNGATFDNVILRDAYEACGFDYPAPFWLDWCYRTVKSIYPTVKLTRVGTHHSAVDDAESQARHLQNIATLKGFDL